MATWAPQPMLELSVQHLKIGSDLIERVRSTKFLGLHIDDKLKWSEHIRHVKRKLSSSLYALRSARNVLSSDQLKTVYHSMFNSYIDYGISLWGSAAQTALKPIDVLQKKALRIITNSAYNAHTDPLFKNQNI